MAAAAGAYEALDVLLDQAGVETDPLSRDARETPLHAAVRWENAHWDPASASAASSREDNDDGDDEDEAGRFPIVGILLDAGCDPRIRDRKGRKAVDGVDTRNEALRGVLRRAEVLLVEGERAVADVSASAGEGEGDGDEGSDGEVVIR